MDPPIAKLILENYDDIDSDSDSGAPILQPVTWEELRAIRAEKRAQKAAEIHAKAEVFRRMGDELLQKGKYEEAFIPYIEATTIWPTNVSYYILLAIAYTRLHWYEEAAHSATRALTLDPKSIEARYLRALARLDQRLLTAAKIDLETVVTHDPSHAAAKTSLEEVKKALEAAGKPAQSNEVDQPSELSQSSLHNLDFSYPQYDDNPLDLDELSNSSDCNHRGNGVPCRFYNRGRCGKGHGCPYSHAPDEKSVRDEIGRNVCIYFLLDNCKFGESKCVYIHTKEFLPSKGWWSDAAQTAKIKDIIALTEKTAKEKRAHQDKPRQSRSSALSKLKSSRSKDPKTLRTAGPAGASTPAHNDPKDGEKSDGETAGQKTKAKSRSRGPATQNDDVTTTTPAVAPESNKTALEAGNALQIT